MTEADKNLAKILDEFPDLLERIPEKMKTEELDPWVKKFSGLVAPVKMKIKNQFLINYA